MSPPAWAPRWVARVLAAALLAVALLAVGPRPALAVGHLTLPPLGGHVVDVTSTLTDDDVMHLDAKLEGFRLQTGFAIVELVVGPLQGEPIEDVAYDAFNQWQIGDKGKDNGVLIVVAPGDRRVRIETGKGVGGALTDLESNDIIHNVMSPLLVQGRLRDALDQGSEAVARALVEGTPGGGAPAAPVARTVTPLQLAIGAGLFVVVIVLLIVSPGFRSFFFFLLQMMLFRGGGGGGGGGGTGGSGYSGGGGRSGGGGSSDSY